MRVQNGVHMVGQKTKWRSSPRKMRLGPNYRKTRKLSTKTMLRALSVNYNSALTPDEMGQ